MNRKERRRLAKLAAESSNHDDETRVPVMCHMRCLELAGPERVRDLLKAPNVAAPPSPSCFYRI